MTYYRICEKCKRQFITGDIRDYVCLNCDGTYPRLQYWEIEKK